MRKLRINLNFIYDHNPKVRRRCVTFSSLFTGICILMLRCLQTVVSLVLTGVNSCLIPGAGCVSVMSGHSVAGFPGEHPDLHF